MIVVKLFGGLGNQMFQYAAGRRAAIRRQVPLALDLRWFTTQGMRAPDIQALRIEVADAVDGPGLPPVPAAWTGSGRSTRVRVELSSRARGWRVVAERLPGVFDASVLSAKDRSELVGYWQSEQYFADVAVELRSELRPRLPSSQWAAAVTAEISTTNSVSLHVRRGDFAAQGPSGGPHGTLPPDYYRRAMGHLDELLSDPVYFAFSDDPDWVVAHLRHPRLRPVSGTEGSGTPVEELALMAACRSHIVANSSFSWWSAWLGDEPAKQVVAPNAWFADPQLRSDDIVPVSWLRL